MKIWVVSMECAGLAEAGGVKNVTHSLCQEFANKNNEVIFFIKICTPKAFAFGVHNILGGQ